MIKLFKNLLGKNKDKPTAAAFVDYEHWYISMEKIYNKKPNLKAWLDDMSVKYNVKEISFFADFSNQSLASEIPKIREITSNVIQTSSIGYKKDFTDFIMLDHIYQRAMRAADVETFIIFSGDGHFSSVVSCLKNICKKDVGIYGVKDAFSNQLKNTASWFVEIPTVEETYGLYYNLIFNNLKNLEEKKYRNMIPTFTKTVEIVSEHNNVAPEAIKEALSKLIENGYISRHEVKISFGKKLMALHVNWALISKNGIWPDEPKKQIKKDNYKTRKVPVYK